MIVAIAIFVFVVLALQVWEYKSSVQEYTIARPQADGTLGSVLREKTPVALETGRLPVTVEDIPLGLSEIDEGRPFWWLPGFYAVSTRHQLDQSTELEWVTAERRWIGCGSTETESTPLLVWLVHSRYRRYLPEDTPGGPWDLTEAEAPWISRVQFVEVQIRPGWCLGIPAHWGYAVKSSRYSAVWQADQHSPCSFVLSL